MNFEAHTWSHGDIITANQLNRIENQINTLSQNTYETEIYASTASTTDKIAVQSTVTNAIQALDKVIHIDDNSGVTADTDASADAYRKVITSIEEIDGKLNSIKYVQIPISTTDTLGLVKIGDNLSINQNGVLSANYTISGDYNSSTNPLITDSAMKTALSNVIADFPAVSITGNTNYSNQQLTITGFTSRSTTNGVITFSRAAISITHDQVNDIHIDGSVNESGDYINKYSIPTVDTVSTMISAEFDEIESASTTSAGLMSAEHYTKLENLDTVPALTPAQITERDAAIAQSGSWTDPRVDGLLSPTDRDLIYDMNETLNNFFIITSGNITGIKVYDTTGANYKILTYDDISATGIPVE